MRIFMQITTPEVKKYLEENAKFLDHPSDEERIAYLEEFQKELDAKAQKKKSLFAWFKQNK
jgi:hypothetical protein